MAPSPYRSLLGNNIDGTPLTLMLGRREFSPDRPPSIEHRGAPRRTEEDRGGPSAERRAPRRSKGRGVVCRSAQGGTHPHSFGPSTPSNSLLNLHSIINPTLAVLPSHTPPKRPRYHLDHLLPSHTHLRCHSFRRLPPSLPSSRYYGLPDQALLLPCLVLCPRCALRRHRRWLADRASGCRHSCWRAAAASVLGDPAIRPGANHR